MHHRKAPCDACPWSKETPPGEFSAARYEELRVTTGSPGAEVGINAPLFACHKTPEGLNMPCAGWLAAVGRKLLHVRLLDWLAVQGEIERRKHASNDA